MQNLSNDIEIYLHGNEQKGDAYFKAMVLEKDMFARQRKRQHRKGPLATGKK